MNKAVSAASSIAVFRPFILRPCLPRTKMWGLQPRASIGNPMPRPPDLKPPRRLSESPPVPEPGEAEPTEENGGPKGKEPTRYGDWENNGICRDF
ncbi:MAG TPA: DUF1674 domain-containing protein [Allosphingosinicella sp.]|nr:DUF1674 domain-containing protein [Allosphingosinicella sp.]